MKKLVWLAILLTLFYGGARLYFSWSRPNSDSVTRVSFEIASGASLSDISDVLQEKELIRDAWAFRMYARYHGLSDKLQAGEYILQRNLTFAEIVEALQTGKSSEIKIVIPEGSTIAQIDEILSRKMLIKSGEFVQCANFCDLGFHLSSVEGYLFPATYFVNPKSFSAKSFIQRLYANFDARVEPFRKDIQESGRTMNEIVIVASMIEREAFTKEEMPKIADVMWKRLDEGIQLGVDATTRYELNNWKTPLTVDDLAKDSPYNTRRNRGLPPTAISNPGIEALEAAIKPEKTDFYYYLHDRNGKVYFGRTLEEHVENKRKYLE